MAAELYTAEFKRRNRLVAAVLTLAAGAAPFLVALAILQMWPAAPDYALGVMTAAAFLCAAAAPWYAHGSLAMLGNYGLRERLRDMIEQRTDESLSSMGAIFVGFSPGERLRIWAGETDRDIGFLYVNENTLVYRGDEFDWSLPLAQVDDVEMAPPVASLRRVIVRWHRPRSQPRAMSLVCREASALQDAARATRRLYEALRSWVDAEVESDDTKSDVFYGYPPTDTSGSWVVAEPVAGSCTVVLAMGSIIVLTAWKVAEDMIAFGQYYSAALWAGLIGVVGTILTSYLLNYMHAWEAAQDSADTAEDRQT